MLELLESVFQLMMDVQHMKELSGQERKNWVMHKANIMLEQSVYKEACSIELLDGFIEFVWLLATQNKDMLQVFRKSCCTKYLY